jgi:formylglycine-generating enzyme required for sulfatase activity
LLAGLVLLAAPARGNNIAISSQCLGAQNTSARTRLVRFDIAWENSWRDSENHDAAWVFLKYSADGGATWRHGTLTASGTNPSGFRQGSGTGLDIVVPSDRKGAFLRRSETGGGAVAARGIQFAWDYGSDLGADAAGDAKAALATVSLSAVEMVYIPAGPFYLGDYMNSYAGPLAPTAQPRDSDKAQNIGPYGCQILTRTNDAHAFKIKIAIPYSQTIAPFDDSDNGVVGLISYFADSAGQPDSCSGIWFNASSGISIDRPTESNMNTNWPTGVKAFYYMRYEVSQAQYRDFLNSLAPTQAVARYFGGTNIAAARPGFAPDLSESRGYAAARFGIRFDNGLYGCDLNTNGVFNEPDDGECVPATCRSANDSLALNDWACLRWVTEFEYEKAARGPNPPVQSEAANAYGGEAIVPSGYVFAGTLSEVPANNAEAGAWVACNIRGLAGPLRSGALATATSTRKKAMAGYYGNMDLSGNVMEDVISVGTIMGRSYSAAHGDGELSPGGYANVAGWPGGENIPFEGVSDWKIPLEFRAVAQRGGEWATEPDPQAGTQPIRLSSRHCGTALYHYDWRGTDLGGAWGYSHGLRGGRSAE